MSRDQSPQNASEILKDLNIFVQEDEQEIQSMPLHEIVAELKEEGIDTEKLIKEVPNLFKKIKAGEELARASEKRKELLAHLKSKISDLAKEAALTREELIAKIQGIFNLTGEQASAYCRKFEEASDADLESLLEDFMLLDSINEKK